MKPIVVISGLLLVGCLFAIFYSFTHDPSNLPTLAVCFLAAGGFFWYALFEHSGPGEGPGDFYTWRKVSRSNNQSSVIRTEATVIEAKNAVVEAKIKYDQNIEKLQTAGQIEAARQENHLKMATLANRLGIPINVMEQLYIKRADSQLSIQEHRQMRMIDFKLQKLIAQLELQTYERKLEADLRILESAKQLEARIRQLDSA